MVIMSSSLAYIRYAIHRDRSLLLLYAIILFCLFPLLAIVFISTPSVNNQTILFLVMPFLTAGGMSLFLPVYLFHYLWNRRQLDLYASIGMKRSAFFVTNAVLGLLYQFVPLLTAILCAVGIMQGCAYPFKLLPLFLSYSGKLLLLCVVSYALNVWITIHCNSMLDAVLMMLAYCVVPLLLVFAVFLLASSHTADIVLCSASDVLLDLFEDNLLLRWLVSIINVPLAAGLLYSELALSGMLYEESSLFFEHYHLLPSGAWIVWLLLAIGLLILARHAYLAKGAEESNRPTRSPLMYPAAIVGITLALLICAVNMFVSPFYFSAVTMMIAAVFLYFIAWFIAQRKVRVTWTQVWILIGLVGVVLSSQWLYVATSGFGLIDERIPKEADRFSLHVTVDYGTGDRSNSYDTRLLKQEKDDAIIAELYELQDDLIEFGQNYDTSTFLEGNDFYQIRIQYSYHGSRKTRAYYLSVDEEQFTERMDALYQRLKADQAIEMEFEDSVVVETVTEE